MNLMYRLFGLFPLFLLAACDVNERSVTLLRCEQTPLDSNFRCPKIVGKGSEMIIKVNTSTQKVQLDVTEFNGQFFPGQIILDKCSVVDAKNWICSSESRSNAPAFKFEIITTHGMYRGHYYYKLEGGGPPYYYSSSVSGLPRMMVNTGLWNYEEAQKHD
ncbi:hypothetical protein LJR220_003056 [Bradyrhizobium sp. LjRoot220]|uniref:hypothetical protein n=1 Tax=Bradyrhizobium sp. LjRoot220 TaxID=3342284 RepID=UPI003ED11167